VKNFINRLFNSPTKRNRKAHLAADYQSLEPRKLLATLTVDTASDVVDLNDGLVSLREAITAANDNAAFGDAAAGDDDGDVIRFAPALEGQTITLEAGEFTISDDLTIQGNVNLTLDGESKSRIFSIETSEPVTLARLTFLNGEAADTGGAIKVTDGNLRISNSIFEGFQAIESGGAIASFASQLRIGNSSFSDNQSAQGGAIYSSGGLVNLFQSTFTSNQAGVGGAVGIEGGQLFVSQSSFTFNRSNSELEVNGGGAIRTNDEDALVIISDSVLESNRSRLAGGAVRLGSGTNAFVLADARISKNVAALNRLQSSTNFGGGGIYSEGNLTIANSSVTENTSKLFVGGGVYLKGGNLRIVDSTISGNRAQHNGGGVSVYASRLAILGSRFLNNRVDDNFDPREFTSFDNPISGGGLHVSQILDSFDSTDLPVVTISDSLFAGNFARQAGGGIHAAGVRLRIINSEIKNNTVFWKSRDSGNIGGGGGLSMNNQGSSRSFLETTLKVESSEFEGNRVNVQDGMTRSFLGGGLYASGVRVNIASSQFKSNTSDGNGGGIAHIGARKLTLVNVALGSNGGGNRAGSKLTPTSEVRGGLGGGLFVRNGFSLHPAFEIQGGTISHNTAFTSGGGIHVSKLASDRDTIGVISKNTEGAHALISSNRALVGDGGGIAALDAKLVISDALFENNASRDGGALFISPDFREAETRLELKDSQIRNNSARRNGGGVSLTDTEFVDVDNLFAENSASNGPDVFSV